MDTTHTAPRPWFWTPERIAEVLTLRNAKEASKGRPCPVAARVVERIEAQIGA